MINLGDVIFVNSSLNLSNGGPYVPSPDGSVCRRYVKILVDQLSLNILNIPLLCGTVMHSIFIRPGQIDTGGVRNPHDLYD